MSEFRLGRSEYWFDPTASEAIARADRDTGAKTKELNPSGQDKPFPDNNDSVPQAKEKKLKKKLRRSRGFTVDELDILAHYEDLVVSGRVYLDVQEQYIDVNGGTIIDNRPFLNHTVLIYLGLQGLDPFNKDTRRELGRVWGFYQLDRKFDGGIDLIARRLRLSSEITSKGKLPPKQKFKIYTRALLLCFSDEVLEERSV